MLSLRIIVSKAGLCMYIFAIGPFPAASNGWLWFFDKHERASRKRIVGGQGFVT